MINFMDIKPSQGTYTSASMPGANPYTESEFYQRTLKPFEDLDFFKERYHGKSRFLRINPDLENDIAIALKSDSDDDINDVLELINISRQIDSPANETPFNSLLATMNLQQEIIDINSKTRGFDANTLTAITIIETLYENMVDEVPSSRLEDYLESAYFIHGQTIALAENQKKQMVDPTQLTQYEYTANRLITYIHGLESRIEFSDYLVNLPEKDDQKVSPEQVIKDDEEISSLFKLARQMQTYGVKLGYKAQDFRTGSLVYLPVEKTLENMENFFGDSIYSTDSYARRTLTAVNDSLVTVCDTAKRSFHKGIIYKSSVTDDKDKPRLVTNLNPRIAFEVFGDGSLKHGRTNRNLAIDAAEHNHYKAFRTLQAEIISNYIDLVSPLELSSSLERYGNKPKLDTSPKEQKTERDSKKSGMDAVRQLLIPRIKAAKELPQSTPKTDNHREIRLHGVVWHIRLLPNGWHASPEAQALASQAGIKLAEGETFVKPHKRGSARLGEVVSHNLINR